jgi:hypothetical protein
MGHWSLTIHGAGPHHNGKDYDIERLVVSDLKAAGHFVEHAAVTIGSRVAAGAEQIYKTAPHAVDGTPAPATPPAGGS